MFNLSLVHYDSMHEYYSNGIISQQLGLWFDQMLQLSHAKLEQLQAYVKLGWRATPGGHQVAPKPETLFTEKLFKKGKDYTEAMRKRACTLYHFALRLGKKSCAAPARL